MSAQAVSAPAQVRSHGVSGSDEMPCGRTAGPRLKRASGPLQGYQLIRLMVSAWKAEPERWNGSRTRDLMNQSSALPLSYPRMMVSAPYGQQPPFVGGTRTHTVHRASRDLTSPDTRPSERCALMIEAELEGKRYAASRARKQRSSFAGRAPRTKMKARARTTIILFRVPTWGVKACHKKAYDHGAESARTFGVAFRGGRNAAASPQRRSRLARSDDRDMSASPGAVA